MLVLSFGFNSVVAVVMHKDKEDGMHHDSQFRNRDLTTYDHTLLDGEMFLQVCPQVHVRLAQSSDCSPHPAASHRHFAAAYNASTHKSEARVLMSFYSHCCHPL
jgi:hypothetical protein